MNCPKCGGRDILKRFHAGDWACERIWGSGQTMTDGEHLHLVCRRCLYDWTTPPIDSERAAGTR